MEHLLKPTVLAALAVVLSAGPLHAQNTKSFVSSTGNDADTCATEATACRTLVGAHGKTNAGGVIHCLDSGDFTNGTLAVTKSIRIDCPGGSLTIGGVAINILAAATDVVHIRGLRIHANDKHINMANTGNAASVRIEDCDLVSAGVQPVISLGNASNANVIEIAVLRTTISGGLAGIQIQPVGGGAKVTLDDVRIVNSGIGLNVLGTGATNVRVAVKNSTIAGSTNQGVRAQATNGLTRVLLKETQVVQNGTGLEADGSGAGIHLSHSTVTQNGTNLSAPNSGLLVSFGNNEVFNPLNVQGAFTTTTVLR